MNSPKNILVTGGAGYIGSHTVVALVEAGYRPVIVDSLVNANEAVIERLRQLLKQDILFVRGDCRDETLLQKIYTEQAIDGVIHFAALKSVGESVREPVRYYENNVGSLIALLASMRQANITRLVFSSSCTVYGEAEQNPVTEQTPLKIPTSPYGATKQMGERIIADTVHASALQATLLRYFNPIGAHPSGLIGEDPLQEPQNLVPILMQAASGQRPFFQVNGDDYPTYDGTCIRDYIHVMDVAAAHVSALRALFGPQSSASKLTVYNIGTGRGTSILELVSAFEKATGVNVPRVVGERREGDIVQTYANVDKAEKELNWKSRYSLEEALRDAWRWHDQWSKTNLPKTHSF